MILKEKRKEYIERQKMTYSDISKIQTNTSSQIKTQYYTVPQITRGETLKINICVAHAHYRNLENPGTYGEELNRILTANNLPNITIPDCPNSSRVLTPQMQEPQAQALKPETIPRSKSRRRSLSRQKVQSDISDAEQEKLVTEKDVVEAKDLGLKLYTTNEKGCPKENFTVRDNKYKFTYEDNMLDDEEIYNLILSNKIILKGCWNKIEIDEYRKIRSGLVKGRSPPGRRDPRVKKPSHDY